ncbi:MAG: hypothetical protein FI729_03000 [SAR202 cluster bacterium]|nr:hypothetical protein [SAR202 cluster bacterium]
MPKEPTNNSRYKSPSTGDFITCAQYVAEVMCNRMAEKENIGSQAHKFWNLPKWKKHYQHQVVLANRLVKKYSEAAIVKAINSPECKRVYSLRYPALPKIIEKYEKIIKQQTSQSATIRVEETSKPKTRRGYGKKTRLQKLRELDGKEEDQ